MTVSDMAKTTVTETMEQKLCDKNIVWQKVVLGISGGVNAATRLYELCFYAIFNKRGHHYET
ncbi:MAG: hypothetical protein CL599_05915 [Alteromonas sp.]|nr:hypothetical protein [Alteromonas sp.]